MSANIKTKPTIIKKMNEISEYVYGYLSDYFENNLNDEYSDDINELCDSIDDVMCHIIADEIRNATDGDNEAQYFVRLYNDEHESIQWKLIKAKLIRVFSK